MTGLIFLAALAALIALLIWLSGLLTRRLPLSSNWKVLLRVLIVVGAFPLMVADEIIGKQQFEALCKANGIESIDVSKATGMRVRRESSRRISINGLIMPIKMSTETIRDASTGRVLFQYHDYFADGGWLMRYTALSMGYEKPMLFDGNGCGFQLEVQIFSRNHIIQIN